MACAWWVTRRGHTGLGRHIDEVGRPDDAGGAGSFAAYLAATHGTPGYVLDVAEVRRRCRAYRSALPDAEVVFAGEAFLCTAMARLVAEEGLSLAVHSAGELAVARAAGFPAERIVLHGNAKTPEDLKAALAMGVGRIVLGAAHEIGQLAALCGRRQDVLLSIAPPADTASGVGGGVDQGLGFGVADGAAVDAVARVLGQPALRLVGLHCQVGSRVSRVDLYERAAERLVRLFAAVTARHGVSLEQLNLGGGHAIRQHETDADLDLRWFSRRVQTAVRASCLRHDVSPPRLTAERGEAIVGPAEPPTAR